MAAGDWNELNGMEDATGTGPYIEAFLDIVDDLHNTPPLFDLPDPPPTKRAKTLRELDAEERPRWVRLRLKNRVPCDECIALLWEAGGVGPYAKSARWRLVRPGKVLLLCHDHADAWRNEGK